MTIEQLENIEPYVPTNWEHGTPLTYQGMNEIEGGINETRDGLIDTITKLNEVIADVNDPTNVAPVAASNPSDPVEGQIYINSSNNRLYVYVNGGWRYVALTA